jgi:uncharacterized protein
MNGKLTAKLCGYAQTLFRCGSHSIHGPSHWLNVDTAGCLICRDTDADLLVVRYFAYLHDAYRVDDGWDRWHGPRSADRLADLPEELLVLDRQQMSLLEYSIRYHTDGHTSNDPTIGACWDSDRLDLGRVGIVPCQTLMSTQPGRQIARLGSMDLYEDGKQAEA